MKYGLIRATLWAGSFLVLALVPMFLAYLGPVAPRTFWTEVGVGLGFVGLGVMLLQFLLTGRYRWVATTFGLDSMLQFHRQMGLVAVGFILAHPTLLFLSDPTYLEYLDPRVQFPRALALAGVTGALLLLLATSLWRLSFRLSYEWWRALHGLLAIFVVFVGTVHVLQVGHYVSGVWKQIAFVALGAGAVILVLNTRVVRPWRMRRRPWRVEAVQEERGDASTLVLTSEEHAGMSFLPGQFAWLTLGETPFTLQQHPFSFSSSAEAAPSRLAFTIKGDGDFSSRVGTVRPGTSAFLEGPYGYFVPNPDPGMGCVMIAGGVGVTPFRSMLRTFADRGDPRELHLIFANVSPDQVIFHEELEELKARLHLTVTHVLEDPPEGWEGESGLIDRDLLERHLPDNPEAFEYFICGPEPLMNIAESALRELGIPQKRLLSERFNMV
jgi:predicted ferric reductase